MLGGVEWGGRAGTPVSGLTASEEGSVGASRRNATEVTAPSAALPQRISLAILFFAYWCVDIVSPALPAIQQSLGLSATGAGLVFSVFFAGRLVTNLPAAWLVERVGLAVRSWQREVGRLIPDLQLLCAGRTRQHRAQNEGEGQQSRYLSHQILRQYCSRSGRAFDSLLAGDGRARTSEVSAAFSRA